jgi:hypothetical protein
VTRHGLHHTRAAATVPQPMAQLVPNVANCLSTVSFGHHVRVRNWHVVLQSHTNAACQLRHRIGQTSPSISQEANSP